MAFWIYVLIFIITLLSLIIDRGASGKFIANHPSLLEDKEGSTSQIHQVYFKAQFAFAPFYGDNKLFISEKMFNSVLAKA